jgi:large subunit ribosomal protein L18
MERINQKKIKRTRRHARIRTRISGGADKPRLAVFRSNKFVYVQLIDDLSGKTLAAASSVGSKTKGGVAQAKEVGSAIAKKAAELKIKKVIFDRGGFIYTGKIKAIADAAREAGLEF